MTFGLWGDPTWKPQRASAEPPTLDGVRAVRKDYDDTVDSPLTKAYGQLARLMFKLHGTSNYPDATATLRLSYGAVAGYLQDGHTIEPVTTIAPPSSEACALRLVISGAS